MNLKHLFYFWKTAKEGGVIRAGEALHVTPQTISGQIGQLEDSLGVELFSRQGRALELTDAGRLALGYADEIFSLGAELEQAIRHYPKGRPATFRVGVSDALPKQLAYRLLEPAVAVGEPLRIVCREGRLERLLTELAVHRLDLVIADTPLPATLDVRAYSHRLAESGMSFVAAPALAARCAKKFPDSLAELPLLVPGEDSSARQKLMRWLEKARLRPKIVGEFDDSALMTAFGQAGVGVFPVPTVVEAEIVAAYGVKLLGRSAEARTEYFAISAERRVTHPCVLAIAESARARFV
ncbi:MAG: transcriptional activator NhaR [Burkholderiales bacterium]|nr:Transcriptional activator protein NhaR [Rhodocyclaceae bacterium]MCZ2419719.1 transcriptional activator NhaR [Burkholderiales bacterium]